LSLYCPREISGEECPFCTTAFDNSYSAGLATRNTQAGILEIQVWITQRHCVFVLVGLMLIVVCPIWGQTQNPSGAVDGEQNLKSSERSIEDLNLVGAETEMPPFSDSPIGIHSAFRQKLWDEGVFLRTVVESQYAQNALQAPVPADDQAYVGESPFEGAMANETLTADLRQFHLTHSQFMACGFWNWVSWRPAGPKAFQIYGLYLYQAFAEGRVEMKAGYVGNNLEVIGLTVGGSAATAAQGVYAVLPFEVGLSYAPLTAPSFNVRIRGPKYTYLKTVAQRSLDPKGGPTEVARNGTGLRFIPHGDKLLLFGEVGFLRPATAASHEAWLRAGYMHNSTPYTNLATGSAESGNHAAFVLMDYQLRQPDRLESGHGLYLGATAMTADARFNDYDSYYELRLYQKAPFRTRPSDMASLVGYYSGHKSDLTKSLLASGHTFWRESTSVTGSYALRIDPGQYLSLGLSYVHGPTITPKAHDALVASASYTVFF
jgi:porin